jgi:hypothetical protein
MANNEGPPRTADTLVATVRKVHSLSAGEMRTKIEDFVRAAYQSGSNAKSDYERALTVIRKSPEEAIIEIARALGECPPHDYPRRWSLIFAVTELRHVAALPLLSSIVKAPLPSEPQSASRSVSVLAEETIVRTTAIEGIGNLARDHNKEALELLFGTLRQPSVSVRRAAVQAILRTTDEGDLRPRILSYLPPEEHYLLELKTPHVREVQQADRSKEFSSEETHRSPSVKAPLLPISVKAVQKIRPPQSHQ